MKRISKRKTPARPSITDLATRAKGHVDMLVAAASRGSQRQETTAFLRLVQATRVIASSSTSVERFGRLAQAVCDAADVPDGRRLRSECRAQLQTLRDEFLHSDAGKILSHRGGFDLFVDTARACRRGRGRGYRGAAWEAKGDRYWLPLLHECVRVACGEQRTIETEAEYLEQFEAEILA